MGFNFRKGLRIHGCCKFGNILPAFHNVTPLILTLYWFPRRYRKRASLLAGRELVSCSCWRNEVRIPIVGGPPSHLRFQQSNPAKQIPLKAHENSWKCDLLGHLSWIGWWSCNLQVGSHIWEDSNAREHHTPSPTIHKTTFCSFLKMSLKTRAKGTRVHTGFVKRVSVFVPLELSKSDCSVVLGRMRP